MKKFINPLLMLLFIIQISMAESENCKIAKISEQTINSCATLAVKYKDMTGVNCEVISSYYLDSVILMFKDQGNVLAAESFKELWKQGLSAMCKQGCKAIIHDGSSIKVVKDASATMRRAVCDK